MILPPFTAIYIDLLVFTYYWIEQRCTEV